MNEPLNSLARLGAFTHAVFGTLLLTGSTPTFSQLSLETVDQAQVSITDTGTGDFIVSVQNFRGLNSYLIGLATGTTISNMVSCTAQSYTTDTDTANFTFKVEDDGSTAQDNGFNFILLAF